MYAQERVSALESERDSWQETAQVLDRELTSANERVERWRSHAQDLEREVNANLEELRGLRAELQR
jgi:predicted  nucleic acid-binding Zn-ribbon protein